MLAFFILWVTGGSEHSRPVVMVLGLTVQVLGFFFYALSVPRKARDN